VEDSGAIIRIIKRPYYNRNGSLIGVMGVYWEITEELKNKEALSENRSQLRMALKSAEIGIWTWDFKLQKLFWDEQCNKIFGFQKSFEGDRDSFINQIHHDERESIDKLFLISDMGKTEINSEFRIIHFDGTTRYIQIQGEIHGDSENKPAKMIGVVHDITRKRLTEETLHSIVRLNQLVDSASMEEVLNLILKEAVRLTESQLGFLHFVNEKTHTISAQQVLDINRDNEETPSPRNESMVPAEGIFKECINKRQPIIQNKNTSEKYDSSLTEVMHKIKRILAIPIIEDDVVRAIISVGNKPNPYDRFEMDQLLLLGENLWNMISRKQLLHSLEEAHDEAIKSNKIKDRFFSIITHDLSNPISNIRLLSDHLATIITDPIPDIETLQDFSKILSNSVITAQDLLKNLLTWSRSQRNALEYQPEIELVEIPAKMAIDSCASIADGKNIKISSSWDKEISVFADSNMLQTILRNLLINAIKFTPVGGAISLRISSGTNGTSFRIQDNGIGMEEEKVDSLFKIEKMKSTRGTNAEKGTGLGLVLCKEFIDCHGGQIHVESKKGEGSIITFDLPLPADQRPTPSPQF